MAAARRVPRIAMIAAAAALTAAATSLTAAPPEPVLLWKVSYDGGAGHHDFAKQLVTTGHAIYVAARSGKGEREGFTLLRYTRSGELRWERHYGGSAGRVGDPLDLAVVPSGGVVLTGLTRHADGGRVTTVRYGAHGRLRWTRDRALDGQFLSDDGPRLAVGSDGAIRVGTTTAGDFLVLAYAADGATQWTRQIDGSDGEDDIATDVAVDARGNTYIVGPAGSGSGGYSTAKLDAAGDIEWVDNVQGPFGSHFYPALIEVGPDGAPVVLAMPESTCGVFQARIWKLAPDGTEQWQTAYPPDPCDTMESVGLRVRPDGSVVILGTELGFDSSNFDFTTLSYDAFGNLEWARSLGGESNKVATALAVDVDGNAYVTGVRSVTPETFALTASYDRAGRLRWRGREELGRRTGQPTAIDVPDDGTVAITGYFYDPERLEDVFTLRYRQPPDPSTE